MKKIKVLVATGSQDKFTRISQWFENIENVELLSFNDFPVSLVERAKVSDEEEKKFKTMRERAIAKVQKPLKALGREFDGIVIATDDTAYFPLVDTEIVDLREPPDISSKGGEIVLAGVDKRLQGIDLANHYARLTDLAVKGKGSKYMPIIWRFGLAAGRTNGSDNVEILANWERKQYIQNTLLEETIEDTGYMMDYIISETPKGETNSLRKKKWDEKEPKKALKQYLQALAQDQD